MSDESEAPRESRASERDITQELRLRPERPRVTRISRKVLIGFGAAGSIAVLGATIWALQVNRRSGSGQELYSTDNRTTADGLANLPRDYTGLPRNVPPLGPPLPGDLGRPIVAAQANGQPVTVPPMPTAPAMDPEEQRRMQEREAARLSKLFAGTSVREQPVALHTSGSDTRSSLNESPYVVDDGRRLHKNTPSRGGRYDSSTATLEEAHAEGVLQIAYAPAHNRRSDLKD